MDNIIIKQAPEIIPVLTDPANLWVSFGLAVATFLVFFAALFQEPIRKCWNRAVLDMEINLTPPDSHKIALSDSKTGQITDHAIYIRIKVIHKKGSAGENVEIMPTNFWEIESDDKLSKLKYFLPISLSWSHHIKPKISTIRVPVGLFRHCNFGYFLKAEGNKAILKLETINDPNPVADGEIPNVIKPGKYQFELLLSGDNVKALRKKWEIEFYNWSDDESVMLKNNIKIKEVK